MKITLSWLVIAVWYNPFSFGKIDLNKEIVKVDEQILQKDRELQRIDFDIDNLKPYDKGGVKYMGLRQMRERVINELRQLKLQKIQLENRRR